jgi:hypothetical protein
MENVLAYLIPIVAIAGGITLAIFNRYFTTLRALAEIGAVPGQAPDVGELDRDYQQLAKDVTELDARVAAMEKSLHTV